MNGFLVVLALIAMAGVVGALFLGLFSMVRGGEFNTRWGNRLMRYRVLLQGAALLLLALAILIGKAGGGSP